MTNLIAYEQAKRALAQRGLTAKEYERELKKLARRFKI